MKLTPRQQRFVDEYLLDLNGTQAAIRAGYSPQTANEQASQLLANLSLKAAVDRALANRANRIQVKQDEVVLELKRIALADPAAAFGPDGLLLELNEMSEDIRRAISSFEVEQRTTSDGQTRTVRRIRFWSKTDALDKLARHLGMLVDRHEVEPKGNIILNIKVAPPEESKEEGSHGGDGLARDTVIDGEGQPEASLLRNGRGH